MIRFPMTFFSPGDTGGGDAGTGDGGDAHWLDAKPEYADLAKDEATKTGLSKYKTEADAHKGHVELQKQFRQSFRVPDTLDGLPDEEVAKVTERLKGILKPKQLRSMLGLADVPDAPEGYEFTMPEDSMIDEQGIKDFKAFAHERGIDPKTAQGLIDFQLAFVKRLNDHREKVLRGMTDNNYKTFLNEDCQGDKDLAGVRLENVKRLLQSVCVDKDGNPDAVMYEKFAARIMYGDRMIELPLLRALNKAAQMLMGTGGAPGGPGGAPGGQINVEQRWPKSANVMT